VTTPQPATALTPAQQARLQERYGAARRTPVGLLAAVVLLAAAFVGWVVWAALQSADRGVRWQAVAYTDVTDRSITVSFDVFKDAGTSASCLVRAFDRSGVEVGRADVPIDPSRTDVHVVHVLAVTERPTAAEVTSCAVTGG